jgi:hypothetical protein
MTGAQLNQPGVQKLLCEFLRIDPARLPLRGGGIIGGG